MYAVTQDAYLSTLLLRRVDYLKLPNRDRPN